MSFLAKKKKKRQLEKEMPYLNLVLKIASQDILLSHKLSHLLVSFVP